MPRTLRAWLAGSARNSATIAAGSPAERRRMSSRLCPGAPARPSSWASQRAGRPCSAGLRSCSSLRARQLRMFNKGKYQILRVQLTKLHRHLKSSHVLRNTVAQAFAHGKRL